MMRTQVAVMDVMNIPQLVLTVMVPVQQRSASRFPDP